MTLLVVKISYFICVGSFSRTNIQTELQQLKPTTIAARSRGTSVSVMFDYGLDDRSIGVPSPAGEKDFFPLASVSRPALMSTQPPVQWVPESFPRA
jgi:hypothetical protein